MYKLLVLLGFISTSLNAQHLLTDYEKPIESPFNDAIRATSNQVCSGNLLLDQSPNQSNGLFSDLDCDFCGGGGAPTIQVVAENFSLAAANTVGQFVIFGGYFPDNTPLVTDDWTFTLYQDNAGLPGTQVYTETNIPTVRNDTGVDLFGVDEYSFLMTPTTPIVLAAGTYWVEIFNNSAGNTDSVFWELGDTDTNSVADSAIAFNYPAPTYTNRAFTYAMQVCQEAFDLDVNVTGLAATNTVTFTNGKDIVPVSANGTTTISRISDATAYNLIIDTQPDTPNQVCTFTSGNETGNMTPSGVTVDVTCVTTQYDVDINVTGLAATNSVSFSNGADTATFSADGTQTISTLDDESAYDVDITVQPDAPDQVCSFDTVDAGTLAGADVTINVSCVTTPYDVNIAVTGLAATNSVSFSNGADTATFNTDGTQTISTLDDESAYDVDITVQPDTPNQVCVFDTADSGNLAGSDVTINVSCTTTQYDVNIAVSGLAATNSVSFSNGADSLTINADGTQTISTLDDESAYDVDFTAQPNTPDQVCTFDTADTGTLAGSDVIINVSCVTTPYTVGVAVTGLAPGNSVVLQNNGGDDLTLNADGADTFATALDDGSAYNVTVLTQPTSPNQTCVVSGASGNLNGSNVVLTVNCSTTQYDVNVNVTGLAATNSVSFSNGADSLTINADGTQTISTLDDESAYDVDITVQPDTPNQVCTFDTADSGTLAGSDVTINVSCVTTQYDVNIAVTGLAATNSVSFSNGADSATFNADGTQTISTLDDESAYNLAITIQPDTPDQVCSFDDSNTGNLAGADVTINVSCITSQYDVNINVSGLAATNSVSFINGADSLTINTDGTQTISTLDDESAFDVDITVQPDTPNQVCSFDTADAGTLAGSDVTINVSCVTTQYTVDVSVTGLAPGNSVVFQNNGGDDLILNADGSDTFTTALDDGSAYNVTVFSQPTTPNQSCVVSGAIGNLNGSNVVLSVSCSINQYDVNISVNGLAATNSVSFSNGADLATFNADGTQTISTLNDESAYNLVITAQPNTPDQVCTFDDPNSGTVAGSDVTINVSCTTTQYDVNIAVTGLAATNSVSFSNGADTATFNADGTQTISTLNDETAFNVLIMAQPDTPD